jgi:site-specific recombinase XerD
VTTELILKPKQLRLEDLPFLVELGHVDGENFVLDHSPKGYKLKTPVTIPLARILAVGQRGLVEYILTSLIRERPRLVPFVLENQSIIELASYFLRYRSGSLQSLYAYTDTIGRYSAWLGHGPDEIIADVKGKNGLPKLTRLQKHTELLKSYVAMLQDRKLTPGRVHSCAKHVKAFYKVNGIALSLPYALPRRVVCKDRAPKPEELKRLLDVAGLREKLIVSMMALGGFREETLTRLRYHHVREDLEAGRTSLHIHVEVEITKGKYADYDTFLGQEAVEYLRLYLDARRLGSPDGKIPPEMIEDSSPLIRDSQSRIPQPIGPKQIRKLIHHLYLRAGLINGKNKRMYDLRVHSLRKFFKTQMEAAGVNSDYVEYMMGHKISTYHDVQSLGIEKLRNAYTSAGLSIKPRSGISKIEMVKEFALGLGLNPEEILIQNTFSEPDTKYVDPQERERQEIRTLMQAIKADLRKLPATS